MVNTIYISDVLVNMFEQAKTTENQQAALLVIYSVLLHETVHYGDWLDKKEDKGDEATQELVYALFTRVYCEERPLQYENTTMGEIVQWNSSGSIDVEKTLAFAKVLLNIGKKYPGAVVLPTVPKEGE